MRNVIFRVLEQSKLIFYRTHSVLKGEEEAVRGRGYMRVGYLYPMPPLA